MSSLVLNMARAVTKSSAAFLTLVGLLSSVNDLMLGEELLWLKAFPQLEHSYGFSRCMNSLMLSEVGALIKGLATFMPLIGFLSSVDHVMPYTG